MLKPENPAHVNAQYRKQCGRMLKSELKKEYHVSEDSIYVLIRCGILIFSHSNRCETYKWAVPGYGTAYISQKKLIDKISKETCEVTFYPSQETIDLIKGILENEINERID